jgi:glycosyltransferase involved in cell wall biosynthesis
MIGGALITRGHEMAEFHETGDGVDTERPRPQWFAAAGVDDAMRALTRWQPDVLFVQGLRSTDLEHRLLSIAPGVLFAHGFAGLCVSGHKMHMRPSPTPCTRVFGPRCLAVYFPRRCGGRNPLTALAEYRLQRERHRLNSRYARVVVGSHYMAEEYARHGFGGLVTIIPLPLPPFTPLPRVVSDRSELLFCGRLEPTKGPAIALAAAARVAAGLNRPVRLTIAGAGTLEAELRVTADRMSRQHRHLTVHFAGWIDDRQRDALFSRTDVLLVPSVWPEPFGLIGIEAGARGVPAVAFDAGGIREWLRDGVNGRLVPAVEPRVDAFAAAVHDCLAMTPTQFDALRANARESASPFKLGAHVEALEKTFEAVRSARP